MKKEKNWKARVLKPILLVGIITGIIWASAGPYPKLLQDEGKSWHVLWEGSFVEAAEADPGAGNSGILEVFIYPHDGDPGTTYAENNSATLEAASYGWANADDSEIDIPHSTEFDIVIRVRGNATHCKRDTDWHHTDLKVEISSDANLNPQISGLTEMTGVVSRNDSGDPYLWMNFYINNAGSGYTIAKSATAEIDNIKFSAYY